MGGCCVDTYIRPRGHILAFALVQCRQKLRRARNLHCAVRRPVFNFRLFVIFAFTFQFFVQLLVLGERIGNRLARKKKNIKEKRKEKVVRMNERMNE